MTEELGDAASFAAARAAALFRTAYALCGDWYLAQDLVQDTLLLVHLRWRRVAAADNPVAYVHTMLVRSFLTQARRRRYAERPSADVPDRDAPNADVDLNVDLMRALDSLAPRDRAVLVLRYLDDRSAEQVATLMRSTAGAVRIRSMRALQQLRQTLTEAEPAPRRATDVPTIPNGEPV